MDGCNAWGCLPDEKPAVTALLPVAQAILSTRNEVHSKVSLGYPDAKLCQGFFELSNSEVRKLGYLGSCTGIVIAMVAE
jgi:hypothetical protein